MAPIVTRTATSKSGPTNPPMVASTPVTEPWRGVAAEAPSQASATSTRPTSAAVITLRGALLAIGQPRGSRLVDRCATEPEQRDAKPGGDADRLTLDGYGPELEPRHLADAHRSVRHLSGGHRVELHRTAGAVGGLIEHRGTVFSGGLHGLGQLRVARFHEAAIYHVDAKRHEQKGENHRTEHEHLPVLVLPPHNERLRYGSLTALECQVRGKCWPSRCE